MTELNPQISIALSSLRLEAPLLKQLSAGRNSRVWRVEARDRTAIVKEYFADHGHNQSRLAAECNFLDYLNSQGHSNIPRLLLRSDEENFAVFSFIGGSKVTQPEELLVTEAADFIIGINSLGDKPRAEQLGFAKDACKTISDHLRLAQVRIDALLEIKQQDEITRSMQHFVKEKIDTGNVPFEMGTLVRLNNVVGTPIIDNNVSDNTVKLYNERRTASNDATGGTHIGNARVYTFNLTDGSYENAGSKWDLYLYDIQTFTAITLNQNITLTQTERVRGVSSGATGYISNAGSNTGTAFNLIGTSGTFVAGESVIINENSDITRVLNSFIAYSADDIRSVLQDTPSKNNAYKTIV